MNAVNKLREELKFPKGNASKLIDRVQETMNEISVDHLKELFSTDRKKNAIEEQAINILLDLIDRKNNPLLSAEEVYEEVYI